MPALRRRDRIPRQVASGNLPKAHSEMCAPEPSIVPQNRNTPLHYVASEGHAAVVETLLAAGAHVHAKNGVSGKGGCWSRRGLGATRSDLHRLLFPVAI